MGCRFFLIRYLTKYAYFFVVKETKPKTIFTKNRDDPFPPLFLHFKVAYKNLLEPAARPVFVTQKHPSQS